MASLLQTLLLQILPPDLDPVLLAYIEKVLPLVERGIGTVSVFKGSGNDRLFVQPETLDAVCQMICGDENSEQSSSTYILNCLLTAWNLLPFLDANLALSDNERRLLCLSLTLQSYDNRCQNKATTPRLTSVITLGEILNFDAFWAEWREYFPEIDYLTQTTRQIARMRDSSARRSACKVSERRMKLPLYQLFSFGTLAAQLTSPADIVTKPAGDRLQSLLKELGIDRTLVYHCLRNYTGLLTNSIQNAVLHFTEKLDWRPILFFAKGVVYLTPPGSRSPDRTELRDFVWEQVSNKLATKMLSGETGLKRDGQGLKVAPQTLEFLPPVQLIRNLPNVVVATINNKVAPATPKRLKRLSLSALEQEFLAQGADLRSDRIAEFIVFLQKEFFGNSSEFITQVLEQLDIYSAITPEQTQTSSGGVNWGWYYVAAYYIANNPHLSLEGVTAKLREIANCLATWAEERKLLSTRTSLTREVFDRYLDQYLELPGWENPEPSFQHELATYVAAKTKAAKQPICSISSGEFASEDQMDSVVLFKPQQYSNKNPLGRRKLKRGISKLWSLEMLLRQTFWSVPTGKLEERQPVFLYLFPAFVHAPQVTKAIHILINQLKRVNLWNVRRFWQEHGMDANALRFYPWLKTDLDPGEEDQRDLPLLAITYTTTNGKTTTDAWIEPAFLALALPLVLGVKVVATASSVPPYNKGGESLSMVQVDESASFWNLLSLPTSIPLKEEIQGPGKHLSDWLNRLLVAYSIHLDCQASPPDPRWRSFPSTVQTIATDVSAIFSFAHSHFQGLSDEKVQQYWKFAQVWAAGDLAMEQQLELTQRLVQEYRVFYRVHVANSTYAILLPLSKVLEDILSSPSELPIETLILQTSGRLHDALRRQEPYKRPLIMDQSLSIEIRVNNEIQAIHQFVTTCVKDLFLGQYKGDHALLQEHRNRIRSGAEFAYRLLAMQEPKPKTKKQKVEGVQL